MIFHERRELWRYLKKVHSVILWGSHWMHTTYCEEEGEKSRNIPNCRRNLFFPILGISRAPKSVWKVLWFLHIAHCCTVCRPTKPTGQAITCAQRTNNRSLRNSWGAPPFTNIRTSSANVSTPPPLILLATPMSHPQRILKESTKIWGDCWL